MRSLVLELAEVRAGDTAIAGGKGANLGELASRGFPIPPGFVISAAACREFFENARLEGELRDLANASQNDVAARCAALQQKIAATEVPQPLADDILAAHGRLLSVSPGDLVCAVRSSATAEDLAGASFAGQHGTYYYVDAGRLLEVVRRCWASLFGPAAVAYRASRGIPHHSVLMAVVVQEMVPSEVSGVAFTANPVSGDRGEIVIESSWGMGAALVDGRVTPDRYIVTRDGLRLIERRIAEKRFMVPARPASRTSARVMRVSLSLERRETLEPDQVETVAQWSLKCEQHFGAPQDVEWAIAHGRFHLLQSRPITTLDGAGRAPGRQIGHDVKGKWVLFKALAENFTEPLTPLTQDLFSHPRPPGLRFIGGRVYMSLDFVRPLVPLKISDEDLASLLYLSARTSRDPLEVSWLKLPLALAALAFWQVTMGVVQARTRDMPDDFMDGYRALCRRVVEDASMDPLAALHRLLLKPPLLDAIGHMALFVNTCSMRFMPWIGVLKKMLARWISDLPPDAVALLCSGSEGVLSAQMGRQIAALARAARASPAVTRVLAECEPEEALARLQAESGARDFLARLEAFLAVHGHRAIKEFELEATRWEENPAPILGMVRNYLLAEAEAVDHEERAKRARAELADRIDRALEALPLERALGLRRRLVALAARRARYYLKLRENSRFYHIMGIGAVRNKVLALEAELLRQGKLKCKDDIFFMQLGEVAALRESRLDWRDLEDRVRERRMEHVRLAKLTAPRTIGIAGRRERPVEDSSGGEQLRGQSASPGRYQGVARVILDPAVDLALRPGEVLVAPYTDPAWTPLFLTAGAAVVEVGSYLSHAGTVAREYGMPCVVDVADCTRRIQSGALLDVDGDKGTVRIIQGAGA